MRQNHEPTVTVGKTYLVNSFELGFINVQPTEMRVEIRKIDLDTNDFELALLSPTQSDKDESRRSIARWFTDIYPGLTKDTCILKNASQFLQLVNGI